MADWYYTQNGEQRGPVSSAQLRQLAQAGAKLVATDVDRIDAADAGGVAEDVGEHAEGGASAQRVRAPREHGGRLAPGAEVSVSNLGISQKFVEVLQSFPQIGRRAPIVYVILRRANRA